VSATSEASAVSAPLVARLRQLDACAVSDALDRLGMAPAVTGLTHVATTRRIAGIAVTVKLVEATSAPPSHRHLGTTAIVAAGPDNVIVVEQRTGIDAASWGGILSRAAAYRGIAGTIIDGPARDVDEAAEIDYCVLARSTTARTARGRIVESATNVTIDFGHRTVSPGDYVLADRSGVVVIDAMRAEEVIATAEDIVRREHQMAAAVAAGTPVTDVMGATYETMTTQPADPETVR
jgi:4-hydroxy-4-methyl-2-oxoglutarate aldolase